MRSRSHSTQYCPCSGLVGADDGLAEPFFEVREGLVGGQSGAADEQSIGFTVVSGDDGVHYLLFVHGVDVLDRVATQWCESHNGEAGFLEVRDQQAVDRLLVGVHDGETTSADGTESANDRAAGRQRLPRPVFPHCFAQRPLTDHAAGKTASGTQIRHGLRSAFNELIDRLCQQARPPKAGDQLQIVPVGTSSVKASVNSTLGGIQRRSSA